MAAIGNKDFLCRSQIEDHEVWNNSIGDFWKELDAFNVQLRAPATAPALIERATAVTDWRNRQFKLLLNDITEARLRALPEGDPAKLQDLLSGIAYIYRRFVEKSAKEPLAPVSVKLTKFLKEIQAGTVTRKEGQGALVPEPHLEVAPLGGDPLQKFKMVLVSPEYSDDEKFGVVAQGFDFAFHIMSNQATKLQKIVRRVVELEATSVNESKARQDLEKKLKDGEAESKKQKDEMGGWKKKFEDSEKAREEQKEKITQAEQRSREQDLDTQDLRQQVRDQAQEGVRRTEREKVTLKRAVDRAWDDMQNWYIFAGLTFMMGFPRLKAKERCWALLSAQWDNYDLVTIPDLAERGRRINIYANRELRKEGCFARITGTNKYSNGRWYVGEFFDDDTLVRGILKGPGGFWYKGPFYDGKPHGKGEEKSLRGTYVGEYQHGKRHGEGVATYPEGHRFLRYEGEYDQGVFDGLGQLWFRNRDCFMGLFEKGIRQKGIHGFANGDRYNGEFKDGRMHGRGVYTMADLTILHDGNFENNEPAGH